MSKADPKILHDAERLGILRATGLLDSPPEPAFDRITRWATKLLKVPVALISLVDEDRQYFKSSVGLPEPWSSLRQTPLTHSICQYVVSRAGPLRIPDARAHPLVKTNRAIEEIGVMAYLGVPLTIEDKSLGALCAIHLQPRDWTIDDLESLTLLAESVTTEIVLRLQLIEARTQRRQAMVFQSLVEHCGDFISLADLHGNVLNLNPAARRMLNLPAVLPTGIGAAGPDAIATNPHMTRINSPQLWEQMRAAVLEQGSWLQDGTLQPLGSPPDCSPIEVRIQAFLLPSEGSDDPPYLATIQQDLSARRRVERELQAARETAEAASLAKTNFLANMSHEVRTPMTSVLGFAEMLLDSSLSDHRRAEALQTIRRNGRHLMHLLDNVLDLSQIEAGNLELNHQACSPWRIALEIESLLKEAADRKRVELSIEARGRLPARIDTDPARVRQILLNLLDNAIKFTDPGNRVWFRIFVDSDSQDVDDPSAQPRPDRLSLNFEVQDQGIGMNAAELSLLFRPFQQADASFTRRQGGSGLGLAIAKRLALALEGDLEVRGEPAVGTRATFRLPIAHEDPDNPWIAAHDLPAAFGSPHPFEQPPAEPPTRWNARILVADDNSDIQRLLEYHLSQAGLTIDFADNGAIAVQKALTGDHSAVLMDMQMPELDGYDATRRLRAHGYSRPIIALTAHAMEDHRELCLRAGCDAYLIKPVAIPSLLNTLERFLAESASYPLTTGLERREASRTASIGEDQGLELLVREYTLQLPEQAQGMRAALSANDRDALASLAHRSKGVAPMYGFAGLGERASRIETACRDRDREDPNLLQELVADYLDEITSILAQNHPD